MDPKDGSVEEIVIDSVIVEESTGVPVPDVLIVPIIDENIYLTILMGAAIMKSGFTGLCQASGRFPRQCSIHPQTVRIYWSTSPKGHLPQKPEDQDVSESEIQAPYEFGTSIPAIFNSPITLRGHFYGTSVWIDAIPDETVKIGSIALRC
jgi:hypothetical protein